MNFIFEPFRWLAKLIETILKLTGRLVAGLIGLAITIVGGVLCATIIGAVIGVPMILFGVMLMVKGIF